ncbi:hypothetical protein [Haloferax sp. YSMS24]|uniref:hypothetical protein n=1 Tax=unclassified Haloferax TaxID=2625095 RepID=UPI00398D13AF
MVPSERFPVPSSDLSVPGEDTPTEWPRGGRTDDKLSLFVVADERVSRASDYLDPVSDLTWLQFIDGLDMFLVVGGDSDFFDTVVRDDTNAETGLWLVDSAGTVQRQWSLPSERREVLSIGRTVQEEVGMWGDVR